MTSEFTLEDPISELMRPTKRQKRTPYRIHFPHNSRYIKSQPLQEPMPTKKISFGILRKNPVWHRFLVASTVSDPLKRRFELELADVADLGNQRDILSGLLNDFSPISNLEPHDFVIMILFISTLSNKSPADVVKSMIRWNPCGSHEEPSEIDSELEKDLLARMDDVVGRLAYTMDCLPMSAEISLEECAYPFVKGNVKKRELCMSAKPKPYTAKDLVAVSECQSGEASRIESESC
eukprot:TRINITY_DN1643_c0_g1_i2.p1 TRINITY_DN1643_c0_g1~~TRINITY_DN1643_c0_g1_i2.p1  ORF type:complete len:236 (+),score=50.50 TRINITY_DN1643_c0_g1_i2:73-780(+)